MKIVFVIKTLASVRGGAERVLCHVASGLAMRGHEITIYSFDEPGKTPVYPIDSRVRFLPMGNQDPMRPSGLFQTLRRACQLRRIFKESRPDFVIGFMHSAYVPLSFGMLGLKIPLLGSEHTVSMYYRSRPFEYIFLILSAFLVRKIAVVSEQARQTFPSLIRNKLIILSNPVQGPEKETLFDKGSTEKIILSVGRLEPDKGQDVLISAFADLTGLYPDWSLRLVGDGSMKETLERQIASLSLEDRIFLPGSTSDVGSEYSRASIFVIPSRYESFGLVVAEALSYQVPVIGFADCPGVNKLIEDKKNGLLAGTQGDRVQSLSHVMGELMSNPERRISLGKEGPKTIDRYKLSNVIDEWEKEIISLRIESQRGKNHAGD